MNRKKIATSAKHHREQEKDQHRRKKTNTIGLSVKVDSEKIEWNQEKMTKEKN